MALLAHGRGNWFGYRKGTVLKISVGAGGMGFSDQ